MEEFITYLFFVESVVVLLYVLLRISANACYLAPKYAAPMSAAVCALLFFVYGTNNEMRIVGVATALVCLIVDMAHQPPTTRVES